MATPWDENAVIAVCRKFTDAAPPNVIVREPYLPYVPNCWNGVLVLAEAQNLAPANDYRDWLKALPSEKKMRRLYLRPPSDIGVRPWDDGSIKLGLKAMQPDIRLDEVAVSNAVPWSCAKGNANRNPTAEMQKVAIAFWREFLAMWRPQTRAVVTVGKTARVVMEALGVQAPLVPLASSSASYIRRVRGLFDLDDLLELYADVRKAADDLGIPRDADKEFFACHAVSVGRSRLMEALEGQR